MAAAAAGPTMRAMARPAHRPLCVLEATAGRLARCPGATCPYWGEANGSGCRLDSVAHEIEGRRELAELLLELRELLETQRRFEAATPMDLARELNAGEEEPTS